MYAQVEKAKENKGRVVADSVGQMKSGGGQGLGVVDKRSGVVAQRQYLEMLKNSESIMQQKSFRRSNLNSRQSQSAQLIKSITFDVMSYSQPFNAVIQRHAYWSTPGANNNIPLNPFAVDIDPGQPRVFRNGGNRNQRLYQNASAARTAAKQDLRLGGENEEFTVNGGNGAGAGVYTFYAYYKQNPYIPYYTKVLANHNVDQQATLMRPDGVVAGPVNHFHAGIIPGQVITRNAVRPWNIVYNIVNTAAEHYFDASTL